MSDSSQYRPVPVTTHGLSDNAAGAIAYLTFIPAIILLLVEPYNRSSFVRFHAWQSIFLSIGAFALHAVLTVIPVFGWILIPFAAMSVFLLWLIALLRALKGDRYHLPFIGEYAERQAGE